MGREGKPNEYTGEGYLNSKVITKYLPLYKVAISYLPQASKCDTILDLGCGIGNFAKMLLEAGYSKYLGIDFSSVVLNKARKQVPEAAFVLADLRSKKAYEIFQEYNVFIILETFEHIKNDLDIVENIPHESLVIFSVPSFDSKFHVRHFKNVNEVVNRFKYFLNFKESKIINHKYFISRCIRK